MIIELKNIVKDLTNKINQLCVSPSNQRTTYIATPNHQLHAEHSYKIQNSIATTQKSASNTSATVIIKKNLDS